MNMPLLECQRFKRWIRESSQGCMEDCEIDDMLIGDYEDESEDAEFVFENQGVESQWQAWKAAVASTSAAWRSLMEDQP